MWGESDEVQAGRRGRDAELEELRRATSEHARHGQSHAHFALKANTRVAQFLSPCLSWRSIDAHTHTSDEAPAQAVSARACNGRLRKRHADSRAAFRSASLCKGAATRARPGRARPKARPTKGGHRRGQRRRGPRSGPQRASEKAQPSGRGQRRGPSGAVGRRGQRRSSR
jgi:hypothetical protein